jgi:hypothetical protein
MPPTLAQRVKAALMRVHERLQRGDVTGAREELSKGRALSAKEPRLVMAGLTEARWDELQAVVESMPDAAVQVLKHAHLEAREHRTTETSLTALPYSPFSAMGIAKLQEARTLNTVNKREIHKNYRRLALQLHPDKCEHEFAIPAMMALNKALAIIIPPAASEMGK